MHILRSQRSLFMVHCYIYSAFNYHTKTFRINILLLVLQLLVSCPRLRHAHLQYFYDPYICISQISSKVVKTHRCPAINLQITTQKHNLQPFDFSIMTNSQQT